jgi:LAO/AO transport system kinase
MAGFIEEYIIATVVKHQEALDVSGELAARRRDQARTWMWTLVEEGLHAALDHDPRVRAERERLEQEVQCLETTPAAAARRLLATFLANSGGT